MTSSSKRLILLGTAAAMLAVAPVSFEKFDLSAAYAQSSGQGNSGNSGSGGGSGGGNSGGGSGNAGSGGAGNGNAGGGSDSTTAPATGSGSGGSSSGGGSGGSTSGGGSGGSGGSTSGGGSGGSTSGGGAASGGSSGQQGGSAGGQGGSDMNDIFNDLAGDDDSDRPDWAGQPGGKDGAGGGQPPTSGTTKGDLFGDLFVIDRDANGVPILTAEGWVQPLDIDGNPIPLDDEGHPLDESLTVEVELGRLNVGRAPTSVLDRRAEEVIALLNDATALTVDAAGRLVMTVDDEEKTIDSPLENLAIYVALMTTGTIPGVTDLPGTAYDFMVDGVYTAEDLAASTAFLAAATDKTGIFTTDEIAYINAFIGINTVTTGSVTYADIDYSTFDYSRADTYSNVTVEVLIQQPDSSWVPTTINVYDVIFGGVDVTDGGSLAAYTTAADDARAVVNYIHEYEVPVDDINDTTH